MPETGSRNLKYGLCMGLLLILYVIGSYQCEISAQLSGSRDQPSSLASTKPGASAAFALVEALGGRPLRLVSPWTDVKQNLNALVVIEPLTRNPDQAELDPLEAWIEAGGTALFICSGEPQPLDNKDPIAGDLELVAADPRPTQINTGTLSSPYLAGVKCISVSSPLRIKPAPKTKYDPILSDELGIVAVHKSIGKGHLFVLANDFAASNSGIGKQDNSVLFSNMVLGSAHNATVGFDEYHHGVGFTSHSDAGGKDMLPVTPLPAKLCLGLVLCLAVILTVSSGKAPGPVLTIAPPPQRKNADYITSMSRLYRASGKSAMALDILYSRLLSDLRSKALLAPDAPPTDVISAMPVSGSNLPILQDTIARCERVRSGETISDQDLVKLVNAMQTIWRDINSNDHE